MKILKGAWEMFRDGGWAMWPILACLIAGVVIGLRRLWVLWQATTNTRRFVPAVNRVLSEEGPEAAAQVCARSQGPLAAIFQAALQQAEYGVDQAEKALTNAGLIQMALLERGMVALSTIISVAPMMGFLGTVWGMIVAFKQIEDVGEVSAQIVAGGISTALLTTLFGLVVAILVQMANNYFVAQIEELTVDMEECSSNLMHELLRIERSKNRHQTLHS